MIDVSVRDRSGNILEQASGGEGACLVYEKAYQPGDCLVIERADGEPFVELWLDNALPPATLFLKEKSFTFPIPFDHQREAYPADAFGGERHRISVRERMAEAGSAYRNLAFNPYDFSGNCVAFPQAQASVETRGEAAFAARNVIDGEHANQHHGYWPFTSWGINRDPEAALTVQFGRAVTIDRLQLYIRADFPHDAWWQSARIQTSDGWCQTLQLRKTGEAQAFEFPSRKVEWLRLDQLEKAEDPSPFPALTQIEIWGRDGV